MTREDYIAIPALNFSMAKHLLKSPAHFKAAQDEEREETEAMRIGTIVHAMVLENKSLLDLYAIKPAGMSFATKEGKQWRDSQSLPILKEEDAEGIPKIAEAIANNPDARLLISGCKQKEQPITGMLFGVECKALVDLLGESPKGWVLGDFKTASDVSPGKFASAAYDSHYDMQLAWSGMLLALRERMDSPPWTFWIATEKKPPFTNVVYHPSQDFIESGMAKVERALSIYKECMNSGKWPMPMRGIHSIDLPKWAKFAAMHNQTNQ